MRRVDAHRVIQCFLVCLLVAAPWAPRASPAGELPRYTVAFRDLQDGMRVVLFGTGRIKLYVSQEKRCSEELPRADWLGSLVTVAPGDSKDSVKFIPDGQSWIGCYWEPLSRASAFLFGARLQFVLPEAGRTALDMVEKEWARRQVYLNANAKKAHRVTLRGDLAIEKVAYEASTPQLEVVTVPHLEPLLFHRARLEVNYASPYLIFQSARHGEVAVALADIGSQVSSEQMARFKTWPQDIQRAVKARQLVIKDKGQAGMTEEMARMSLGDPTKVETVVNEQGTRVTWTYGHEHAPVRRTLEFKDGRLIQHGERQGN